MDGPAWMDRRRQSEGSGGCFVGPGDARGTMALRVSAGHQEQAAQVGGGEPELVASKCANHGFLRGSEGLGLPGAGSIADSPSRHRAPWAGWMQPASLSHRPRSGNLYTRPTLSHYRCPSRARRGTGLVLGPGPAGGWPLLVVVGRDWPSLAVEYWLPALLGG